MPIFIDRGAPMWNLLLWLNAVNSTLLRGVRVTQAGRDSGACHERLDPADEEETDSQVRVIGCSGAVWFTVSSSG